MKKTKTTRAIMLRVTELVGKRIDKQAATIGTTPTGYCRLAVIEKLNRK